MSRLAVIARHGRAYTVTRTAEGSLTAGRWADGATSSVPIVAYVEPVNGIELKAMAEARKTEDIVLIITATELLVEPAADKIAIGSKTYEVFRVQTYTARGETHHRAYASKVPA